MGDPSAYQDDFTCGWYCNLCLHQLGDEGYLNPGLLSATLMIGHGMMVHGFLNGTLDRFIRHDTTWYDDCRDLPPDLVVDDSPSEPGSGNEAAISDGEEHDPEARDLDFVNIADSADENDYDDDDYDEGDYYDAEDGYIENNQYAENDQHVENAQYIENEHFNEQCDAARFEEDEDIYEDDYAESSKQKKTSSAPKNKTRSNETNVSTDTNNNQSTRDSANFPYITCDRCDKTGKECHMDLYYRICADCDKQAKSCTLNKVSCASLWKDYEVNNQSSKATWTPPVFTSAAPDRRWERNQKKQASEANIENPEVENSLGNGGSKRRKASADGHVDGDSEGKKTKRVKESECDDLEEDA